MGFLFPVLAAFLQAGAYTIDKVVLSLRRMDEKAYLGVSFPLGFLFTLVIFLVFRPPFTLDLFSGNLKWLLACSVGISLVTNYLFYHALKSDGLGEMQTIDLLQAIPTILVSSLFFADERNIASVLCALAASAAVVWSHWERGHLRMAKRTLPYAVWSLTVAPFAAPISKALLSSWSPISYELVRCGLAAVAFGWLFRHSVLRLNVRSSALFISTNFLTAVAWILYFYGYQQIGIVGTVLLFSLQPLLVYFASVFVLKERFQWKKTAAFAFVLLAIAVAQAMG